MSPNLANAMSVIDLVEECLSSDEGVPESVAEEFLSIFSPDEQVLLMQRSVQIANPFL